MIKVTEIFLVPSSFLVAALGTADTNFHRAAVSLVALIISVLWWVCSQEATSDHGTSAGAARSRRLRILCWLPIVFMVGWFTPLVIHAALVNRPIGAH
jgi:hypothetical protein